MQQTMKEKMQAKMANSEGFTLLEILVVLTIMGFLIAMVAPRLAGISGSAIDTVCDSNQSRQIQMTAAYFERTNAFPDKLTNIVMETNATGGYAIPSVDDGNPDDGPETLSGEFAERVKPVLHYLNQAEVDELADMGITRVFNLNSYENATGVTAEQAPMRELSLADGVAVMMSGIGMVTDNTNAWSTGSDDGTATAGLADLTGYGEAEFLGRILFGFGPENGLVTSGIVSNAAHCPGGLVNSDNVTYNDYNLVVPRLAATVARDAAATTAIVDRASLMSAINSMSPMGMAKISQQGRLALRWMPPPATTPLLMPDLRPARSTSPSRKAISTPPCARKAICSRLTTAISGPLISEPPALVLPSNTP
jgi:prepilin-type N-terminal cleavage/methylation domain-containing protein